MAIESPEAIVVVARNEDELVGFAIANLNQVFRKAIIENVYVAPSARGNGIDLQLLERVCSIATVDRSCAYIVALVPTDAQGALAAYAQADFTKGNTFVWLDRTYAEEFRR